MEIHRFSYENPYLQMQRERRHCPQTGRDPDMDAQLSLNRS